MPSPQPFAWRPSRREAVQLALVTPLILRPSQERRVQTASDGEPHFVDPPGEPSAERKRRIEELALALAAGKTTTNEILAGSGSNELRPYPAFRELIAKHAPVGRAVLTPRDEPGVAMLATVRVVDRAGRPYPGVRVYAYQTSAKGWYAAEAPHVSGNSGDTRFARLFTHGITDADGRCELVTIHPAGYPRSDLPSHVHLRLEGQGGDERWTEIRFEDCPRMTPRAREESLRAGYVVAPVEELEGGGLRCTAEFELPERRG
jgi:protocatechuate 3,4-dioxygenase beta subunit